MDTHKLTCHCGAIELAVKLADGLNTARRCDCSFCRRRGAIAVSVNLTDLKVVKGVDKLTLYTWGSHTAKHYFCAICGNYTHHQRRSNPNEFGVNVAAIIGINPRDLKNVPWANGVNHPSDRKK